MDVRPHDAVDQRVRDAVRDGVGVCAFSLAASGSLACLFVLLARLAG